MEELVPAGTSVRSFYPDRDREEEPCARTSFFFFFFFQSKQENNPIPTLLLLQLTNDDPIEMESLAGTEDDAFK